MQKTKKKQKAQKKRKKIKKCKNSKIAKKQEKKQKYAKHAKKIIQKMFNNPKTSKMLKNRYARNSTLTHLSALCACFL